MNTRESIKIGCITREVNTRNKEQNCLPVYSITNSAGFVPSTDYFSKEVFSKDLSGYKIVPHGCFAYNPSRINVGSIAWQSVLENVIVSPMYIVFQVDEFVDRQYLWYYLRSDVGRTYINHYTSGSVRDTLKFSSLCEIPVPMPSHAGQIEIAGILDAVSEVLRLRNAQLAELDNLVKSQFVEMFGDPVTNPMRWSVRPLGDVFTIIDGDRGEQYPKGTDFYDAGYCAFLNAGNVTANGFDFSSVQFITEEKDKQLRKGRFELHDIVVTTRGTVGNTAVYSDNSPYENMRINSGMVLLRNYRDVINPEYFIMLVRGFALTKSFLSGSAQPQLPITNMKKIPLPLPPLDLQTRFADFVRQADKSKFAIQQSLDETQRLFDSLMAEYFE